jgi:hypothetical protein
MTYEHDWTGPDATRFDFIDHRATTCPIRREAEGQCFSCAGSLEPQAPRPQLPMGFLGTSMAGRDESAGVRKDR